MKLTQGEKLLLITVVLTKADVDSDKEVLDEVVQKVRMFVETQNFISDKLDTAQGEMWVLFGDRPGNDSKEYQKLWDKLKVSETWGDASKDTMVALGKDNRVDIYKRGTR